MCTVFCKINMLKMPLILHFPVMIQLCVMSWTVYLRAMHYIGDIVMLWFRRSVSLCACLLVCVHVYLDLVNTID